MSDDSPFITMGASPRAEVTPATTSPAAAFASSQQGEPKGIPSGEREKNNEPPAAARASHPSPNNDGSVPPKFMNRFSSWKKNNLSVLSTHATELLQQTSPAVKNLVERRNQAFRNNSNAPPDSTTSAAGSSVPPSIVEDGTDDANEDSSESSSSSMSSSDESEDKPTAAVPDTPVSEAPGSAAAALIAETAAAVWNENVVPQGFRGRYSQNNDVPSGKQNKPSQTAAQRLRFLSPRTNASANNNNTATPGPPGTQSQMALILKSSAASHMENILETLEPGQFVMLLGPGMLGVNLKQSFLKLTGVYIDFMVRAGAAHNSKVVSVGDALLKVGGTDVSRGTINDVPQTIASTKRPCILVFSKAGHVTNDDDLGPVDIAVAWTHKLISDNSTLNKTGISTMPLTNKDTDNSKSLLDDALNDNDEDDDVNAEAKVVISDEEKEETKANDKETGDALSVGSDDDDKSKASARSGTGGGSVGSKKSNRVKAASFHRQNAHALAAEAPSQEVKASLAAYASKRSDEIASFVALSDAAKNNEEFKLILSNALLACVRDPRRLPFFLAHVESEEKFDVKSSPERSAPQGWARTRLMVYLELQSFSDLLGVTPVKRQRDFAKRIAAKVLGPDSNNEETSALNVRSMFPLEMLDKLDKALEDESTTLRRDLFAEFQKVISDSLCGPKFTTFLLSKECARMRAFLRNTAPFVEVPLEELFHGVIRNDSMARNQLQYMMMHMICQFDADISGENPDSVVNGTISETNKRLMGSAGGVGCYIFIERDLKMIISEALEALKADKPEFEKDPKFTALIQAFENLWEVFIAPGGGALDTLSSSSETEESLDAVRRLLVQAVSPPSDAADRNQFVADRLAHADMMGALVRLSENLLCDYAMNIYPKYRGNKFHEWMSAEVAKYSRQLEKGEEEKKEVKIPHLPEGCIKRLMRRTELPMGVSSHKPLHTAIDSPTSAPKDYESSGAQEVEQTSEVSPPANPNADLAIVFGTDDGLDVAERISNLAMSENMGNIRRFACAALSDEYDSEDEDAGNVLTEECLPSTLESYAIVPPFRERPFNNMMDSSRISDDGWEVSLVNFMIPNVNNDGSSHMDDSSIYGVSLIFHRPEEVDYTSTDGKTETKRFEHSTTEVIYSEDFESLLDKAATTPISLAARKDNTVEGQTRDLSRDDSPYLQTSLTIDGKGKRPFASPISVEFESDSNKQSQKISVSSKLPEFNNRLKDKKWTERVKGLGGATIGVALVSSKNVIPAMRETLSQLFNDYSTAISRHSDEQETASRVSSGRTCGMLVDLLGNLAHHNVEKVSLYCMLEPYINYGNIPWLASPVSQQKTDFQSIAGQQLIQTLPPVPLALLFITMLLEQKVVLSSSRRSILLSVTNALGQLLKPLEWSHLFVPLVPAALATDLVQYPAPFILGIPSEDQGSMELLSSLPKGVTLVDLDVGRVILASSFGDSDSLDGGRDKGSVAGALRSQVLYLAEALGGVFGAHLNGEGWCCDSPLAVLPGPSAEQQRSREAARNEQGFETLQRICGDFIAELLAGSTSCCFRIEEYTSVKEPSRSKECTILLDEDRFFHIKNLRAQDRYMPLLLDDHFFSPEPSTSQHGRLRSKTNMALSLDDFDLVLELFLRGQSISTFMSSRPINQMVYN